MTEMSKRDRLIASAAELFHQDGLAATSLADIAKHAEIPIGNVYYYFKTKEELALAAIARQKALFTTAYERLDAMFDDPRERLVEAVKYHGSIRDTYARSGCPIGRMVVDGNMEKDPVCQAAAQVFSDFVNWAERQFRLLGHYDAARSCALSLLTTIQGSALMAKSFRDADLVSHELERLVRWLNSLQNKRIPLGKVGARSVEAAQAG